MTRATHRPLQRYLPSGLNATSFFYVCRVSLPLLFPPSPSLLLNGGKKPLFAFDKFPLRWILAFKRGKGFYIVNISIVRFSLVFRDLPFMPSV